jgi:hypothetical protein
MMEHLTRLWAPWTDSCPHVVFFGPKRTLASYKFRHELGFAARTIGFIAICYYFPLIFCIQRLYGSVVNLAREVSLVGGSGRDWVIFFSRDNSRENITMKFNYGYRLGS